MDHVYSVTIDTWGEGAEAVDIETVAEVGFTLNAIGAEGASASVGGLTGGIGAVFGIVASHDSDDDWERYAEISRQAVHMFVNACDKVGAPFTGVAHLDISTERYTDLELEREPEGYAGTAEVADYLHISKQRVSELRREGRMPSPVAELRAGPVWTQSSLKRFLDGWDRTPGRRRAQREDN